MIHEQLCKNEVNNRFRKNYASEEMSSGSRLIHVDYYERKFAAAMKKMRQNVNLSLR